MVPAASPDAQERNRRGEEPIRLSLDVSLAYSLPEPHDVLLQIAAAALPAQKILSESLTVTSAEPLRAIVGEDGIGQRTLAAGEGHFVAEYRATVEIRRPSLQIEGLAAVPPRDVPADVLPYLLPSRYCNGEPFDAFVKKTFGGLNGGAKVLAMRDWVESNLAYVPGSSNGITTAADTFVQRQGVCRDYAHLLVALVRAAHLPARVVSVYAPRVEPQDFHAVVEVWLEGGWHLIDPTGMAKPEEMAIIGVGRDATDIAFMTVFGSAAFIEQRVLVSVLPPSRELPPSPQ